jgi:hypothetical protein
MRQRELISRVKGAIRSIDPLAKVILFGSRARGEEDQGSFQEARALATQGFWSGRFHFQNY